MNSLPMSKLKLLYSVILSPLYWVIFGVTLVFFHLLCVILYTIGGKKALQPAINGFYFSLVSILNVLFIRSKWSFETPIKYNRPIIFVANHKHRYDIPAIYWFLRKFDLRWVSKKELSKGVPAISYILRKTENALINRSDAIQSSREIIKLAKSVEERKGSVVIFPEGTRSHSDKLKPFKSGGLGLLMEHMPTAIIVPIAITNTQKINDSFLLTPFLTCYWDVLEPIDPIGMDSIDVTKNCKKQIEKKISMRLGLTQNP